MLIPIQLTAAKHARPFAAFLAKNGEPVERVLDEAGLPPTCLDDPKLLDCFPLLALSSIRWSTSSPVVGAMWGLPWSIIPMSG